MNSEYIVKTFGDFVIENTHNIILENIYLAVSWSISFTLEKLYS
jgi:hypothetical protein